ncbi:MAG: hypothetical protein ACPKM0_05175 [Pleomorphochaeta sp.]
MFYKAGEQPGKGIYYCTNDFEKIILDSDSDILPSCPKCGNDLYIKVD